MMVSGKVFQPIGSWNLSNPTAKLEVNMPQDSGANIRSCQIKWQRLNRCPYMSTILCWQLQVSCISAAFVIKGGTLKALSLTLGFYSIPNLLRFSYSLSLYWLGLGLQKLKLHMQYRWQISVLLLRCKRKHLHEGVSLGKLPWRQTA